MIEVIVSYCLVHVTTGVMYLWTLEGFGSNLQSVHVTRSD